MKLKSGVINFRKTIRPRYITGFIVWGILVLSLLTCSHHAPVTVPLTSSRLDPPELSTQPNGVSLGFNVMRPNEIIVIPDGKADPPIFNAPRLSNRSAYPNLSPHMALPVKNRFELSYDIYSGLMLRAQLLGQDREASKVGNKSTTLSIGYNFNSDSNELYESDRPGTDFILAEYDWRMHSFRTNLLYGYRIHKSVLGFGGAFYETFSLTGHLNQYAFPALIESDEKYDFDGQGTKMGLGLGVEFLFDAKVAEQSIIYTLHFSKILWDNLSTDIIQNHSLIVKYYF